MNNAYTLIWSFRNRLEQLSKSIQTADSTVPKHVDFCLVDAASNPKMLNSLKSICQSISERNISICESMYRSSLSEAWNLGMMLTPNRYVMFSSSDVVFNKSQWFTVLVDQLKQGEKYILLQNHAVFALDKAIIPEIGWFDERFGIGAHLDTDYMIRASEAGISVKLLPNDGYYVHDEENISYVERVKDLDPDRLPIGNYENEKYFMKKWQSSWLGWEKLKGTGMDLPHPPTNISVCKRGLCDIDPHPIYTEKIARDLKCEKNT